MTVSPGSDSTVLVSVWTADRVFGLELHSMLLRPGNISSFLRTVPFGGVRMAVLDEWVKGVNPTGWMGIEVDGRSKSHSFSGAGKPTRLTRLESPRDAYDAAGP